MLCFCYREMHGCLPQIIGIVGRRRSGKDTAAAFLAKRWGYTDRKFAGPLKEALRGLFNLSDEQLEGELKDVVDGRWGVAPRRLMQYFGTDVMQHSLQTIIPGLGRGYAVRRLFADMGGGGGGGGGAMITISDVRFQHEATAIRERGGMLLRIIRNNIIHQDPDSDSHSSETELEGIECDRIIENNGGIDELYDALESMDYNVKNKLCENKLV